MRTFTVVDAFFTYRFKGRLRAHEYFMDSVLLRTHHVKKAGVRILIAF